MILICSNSGEVLWYVGWGVLLKNAKKKYGCEQTKSEYFWSSGARKDTPTTVLFVAPHQIHTCDLSYIMGTLQEVNDVPDYLRGENQNVALFEAASEGDVDRLREALNNGANANYFDQNGELLGALHAVARSHSASENGSALCATELIEKGARVSAALISNRNEAIHEAAAFGSKDVCRVLLESSPQCAGSENAFGNTALHAAVRSGSADVVKLLLERGADINKQNHRGSSALHIACFLASNGKDDDAGEDLYLKIGEILLSNDKLQIDLRDVNGYTPLHIAAQRGCDEMVKLLIGSGASLTAKTGTDSKGRGARTPLGMAQFGGHDSTIKLIEDASNSELNGSEGGY